MKSIFNKLYGFFQTPQTSSSRKDFLRGIAASLGAAPLVKAVASAARASTEEKLNPRTKRIVRTFCDLAVVKGDSPAAITRKAVQALGGMEMFVNRGDVVVVKPNIGWDRGIEYAANTNPEVVATLIKLCYAAGAKKVKVFDRSCNTAAMCYANSGIAEAAKKAGADLYHVIDSKFIPARFPAGSALESWPIYSDAVYCDCFINVPIAKHHSLSGLTLSMKNLMGVCGGSRGQIHWDIDKKLPELTRFINPDLTVIDAYRILVRNGPSGGNLKDVKTMKTIIAGTDPVLADSYAATLFGKNPKDIGHIRFGETLQVGTTNIAKATIKKITI
jgi:uncharacterized protein (DUF362 family)